MNIIFMVNVVRQTKALSWLVALIALSHCGISSGYAQANQDFIIDQHGAKYPGKVRIRDKKHVRFKEGSNRKWETLTLDEIRAFQMEEDSFLVVKNYHIPLAVEEQNGFAKVILNRKENSFANSRDMSTDNHEPLLEEINPYGMQPNLL